MLLSAPLHELKLSRRAENAAQALTSKPVRGRPPRLSEAQKRRLLKALARGSRRWGFAAKCLSGSQQTTALLLRV